MLGLWHQDAASKTPPNLEFLKRILLAFKAGKMSKKIWQRQDQATMKTMRDHDGAVTLLLGQIENATRPIEPLLWDNRYPGIFVAQDTYRGQSWTPDAFAGAVTAGLNSIASRPIGKAMLESLSDACHQSATKKVVIQFGPRSSTAAPIDVVTPEFRAKIDPTVGAADLDVDAMMGNMNTIAQRQGSTTDGRRDYIGGAGTAAVVSWLYSDPGRPGHLRPPFIALAHELVHAYHFANGLCYRAANGGIADGQNSGIMEEEMRTVGFGAFEDESPSENAIRAEHGVVARREYTPHASFHNVTASVFL